MTEFKVGAALGEAFKNIYQNRGKLIILYTINLVMSIAVSFLVLGSLFNEVIRTEIPDILSTARFFNTTTSNLLYMGIFFIGVTLYQAVLAVVYVKIFDNTIFDAEMTFFELIVYGFSKMGTMILMSLSLMAIALPVLFLIIVLARYLGFGVIVIALIGFYTCSIFAIFLVQGLVVDELTATETIKNSIKFVKNNFLKVLGLMTVLLISIYVLNYGIKYVSAYIGYLGAFVISLYQFASRIYLSAALTEFYCQSNDYNQVEDEEKLVV